MKTLKFFLPLIFSASLALAGFNVTSSVFTVADWDKAVAEAKSKGEPVTVLYSDKNTDCPLCANTSSQIIKEFRSKSVLIYVEHPDWAQLPDQVKTALNAKESGKYIPKTVIMSPDCSDVLAYVPYSRDDRQFQQSIQAAEKKIREAGGSSSSGNGSGSSFDEFFKKQ